MATETPLPRRCGKLRALVNTLGTVGTLAWKGSGPYLSLPAVLGYLALQVRMAGGHVEDLLGVWFGTSLKVPSSGPQEIFGGKAPKAKDKKK